MAKLDFSSIQVKGSAGNTTPERVNFSFSTIDSLKTKEERSLRDDAAYRRFNEKIRFEAEMLSRIQEVTKEVQTSMDKHAMVEAMIERSRIVRAHRMGGDAIYEAAEALMAASAS